MIYAETEIIIICAHGSLEFEKNLIFLTIARLKRIKTLQLSIITTMKNPLICNSSIFHLKGKGKSMSFRPIIKPAMMRGSFTNTDGILWTCDAFHRTPLASTLIDIEYKE